MESISRPEDCDTWDKCTNDRCVGFGQPYEGIWCPDCKTGKPKNLDEDLKRWMKHDKKSLS